MPRGVKGSGTRICVDCDQLCKIRALDRCSKCYVKLDRKRNPAAYRARERKRHAKHRTKRLAIHKEWCSRNKQRIYELGRKILARVEKIKTSNPCADCEKFYPPECMDFDHINGSKRDNVSHLVVGRY